MATHLVADHRLILDGKGKTASTLGEIRHRVSVAEGGCDYWEARCIPVLTWDWMVFESETDAEAWVREVTKEVYNEIHGE